MNEPRNNLFVKVTTQFIEKTALFANCIDKLAQAEKNAQSEYFHSLFQDQIKILLKLISELQNADPLIVYESLG